jgi:hypothetical protein
MLYRPPERGFAAAAATRGLSGRPLDSFGPQLGFFKLAADLPNLS